MSDRKNSEGYSDPTAYQAMMNLEIEELRFKKLLRSINISIMATTRRIAAIIQSALLAFILLILPNSIERLVISVHSRMTLIWCIHLQHSHDGIVCEIEQRITNGLIRNLLLVAVIT